jgi:hypothetical protein
MLSCDPRSCSYRRVLAEHRSDLPLTAWGEGDLAPAFFAWSFADYLTSFMGAPQQFPGVEDVFPHFAHLYCAIAFHLLS